MSYQTKYALAIVLALTIAAVGAIQAADPNVLGIPPRLGAWLSVLVPVLGVAQGFLPRVTRTPEIRRVKYEAAREGHMPGDLKS